MYKQLNKIWNSLEGDERENLKLGLVVIVVLGCVFIFLFPFLFSLTARYNIFDFSNKGEIGDLVNGVAGPFIALVGAILTFLAFYIQYKANNLQRKSFALQQFDTTFFNMVSNHHEIVNSINENWRFERASRKIEGRELFKDVAVSISAVYVEELDMDNNAIIYMHRQDDNFKAIEEPKTISYVKLKFCEMSRDKNKLNEVFMFFYKEYRSAFSHYFRNLYHIFSFIDTYEGFNGIYEKEEIGKIKSRYIKIMVAQLSSYELVLMWYNSLQPFGKKFSDLMIKHELLDNIDCDASLVLQEELFKEHSYLDR